MTNANETKMVTKKINGHEITLETGRTYQMVRSILKSLKDRTVTVWIKELGAVPCTRFWEAEMEYDEANELMWAFDELDIPHYTAREW